LKKLLFSFLLLVLTSAVFSQEFGWQVLNPASIPGSPYLSDVFFTDDNTSWISSSNNANIYKTDDGATSFLTQTTSLGTSTEAIYMIDADNGFCGGGSGFVYNTINGGINWDFLGTMSSTLTDMDFVNANQGYACGDGGDVFSITPEEVENMNSGQPTFFSGISSPSVDNVWVCGGGALMYYNGTQFDFQSAPAGSYNSIYFINNEIGWVVGDSGLIGHTENGGESWSQQTNPSSNALYDVFFLDTEVGWAVGFNGIILHTTNGGDTWVVEGAGLTTSFLRGVHFTSPTNGYVVGNDKTLLKYGELTSAGNDDIPSDILLSQNYPNPFNPSTNISFSILEESNVELSIFNIRGQKVKQLISNQLSAGQHSIIWNGEDESGKSVGSGIYYYKLNINGKTESIKKCLLLK
jgi:photosystem II stability/assembly factor-like uncharacterized protein